MRLRSTMSLPHVCLLAFVAGAAPAAAQVLAPNLIYTSVEACRVFDTRLSTHGKLIHGVPQTFNVVGGNGGSFNIFLGQGSGNPGAAQGIAPYS